MRARYRAPIDAVGRRHRAVVITLAVGLTGLALGLVALLSQEARRSVGGNPIEDQVTMGPLVGGGEICQDDERLPAGAGALRVSMYARADSRPQVSGTVIDDRGVTARVYGGRWDSDGLLIAFRPPIEQPGLGRVCITVEDSGGDARTMLHGQSTGLGATLSARPLPIRLQVRYLRAARQSWWSFTPVVAERMGFNHAWSGGAVAFAAAVLTLISIGLGAWQLTRTD